MGCKVVSIYLNTEQTPYGDLKGGRHENRFEKRDGPQGNERVKIQNE